MYPATWLIEVLDWVYGIVCFVFGFTIRDILRVIFQTKKEDEKNV